jgi:hypothetical protein
LSAIARPPGSRCATSQINNGSTSSLTPPIAQICRVFNSTPSETASARERRAALGDLSDLPKELLAQLSVQRGDQLEDDILDVIESNGGTANVDQILIDLYRKTKKIHERRFIANKLYRMGKAGAVYAIPKKRGVYSLDAPDGSHTENDLFDEMTEAQPS